VLQTLNKVELIFSQEVFLNLVTINEAEKSINNIPLTISNPDPIFLSQSITSVAQVKPSGQGRVQFPIPGLSTSD